MFSPLGVQPDWELFALEEQSDQGALLAIRELSHQFTCLEKGRFYFKNCVLRILDILLIDLVCSPAIIKHKC